MKAYALEINSTLFFLPVFELVFPQIKFVFFFGDADPRFGDGYSLGLGVGLGVVMEIHDLIFCSINVSNFSNSSYLISFIKLEASNFKFSGQIGQTSLNKSAAKAHRSGHYFRVFSKETVFYFY